MIFLLNREYVMWEVVELARLHICEVLRLSTAEVEATLDLAGDKLSPEFQVDLDACKGITPDEIREVMRRVYADCKEEAEIRLKGVTQTRSEVMQWLRGGMSDEEYAELHDPAAEINPESMADHLASVIPIRGVASRWALARARMWWRLRDAGRWVRLLVTGIGRRLAFWR